MVCEAAGPWASASAGASNCKSTAISQRNDEAAIWGIHPGTLRNKMRKGKHYLRQRPIRGQLPKPALAGNFTY